MCAEETRTAPKDGGAPEERDASAATPRAARARSGVYLRIMGMPCFVHVIRLEGPHGPRGRAGGAQSAP